MSNTAARAIPVAPKPVADPKPLPEPQAGGSYVRDPQTGELSPAVPTVESPEASDQR